MSTRCQVLITDKYTNPEDSGIMFYRHSDGYPSGVEQSLKEFLNLIKDGYIRDNCEQAAGWLIMVGNAEYSRPDDEYRGCSSVQELRSKTPDSNISNWKVGAYEPSVHAFHGDIEYFYVVSLDPIKVTVYSGGWDDKTIKEFLNGKPKGKNLSLNKPWKD